MALFIILTLILSGMLVCAGYIWGNLKGFNEGLKKGFEKAREFLNKD